MAQITDQRAVVAIFGPSGVVGKDIARRCIRVQNRAKVLCPVDRGRLRASITHRVVSEGGVAVGYVGTNVEYAMFVHDGTGVEGPRHRMIVPVSATVLRWPNRASRPMSPGAGGRARTTRAQTATSFTYSRYSRGVRPRPFLRNALPAAA